MKYLELIGTHLKDDFLLDLFETYDVEVVYEYDRTHENIPDQYLAEVVDLGLQFVFDQALILKTIFINQADAETWNPFDEDDKRMIKFSTKAAAQHYANEHNEDITEGRVEFLGEEKDWIRFNRDTHSIHYEYVESDLRMITIEKTNA